MRGLVISLVCVGLLAGCGVGEKMRRSNERVTFGGYYFKASLKAVKEDPRMFDVIVKGANQSREAAEDAGRYEATRHCVTKFGNSKLEWLVVQETEDGQAVTDTDTMILRGRCEA